MNKQQQLRLAAFFQELGEAQLAQDTLKHELVNCKSFTGEGLFANISQGANVITIDQMTEYARSKGGFTDRDVYELFEKFDWRRAGVIAKQDFLAEITPFKGKLKPSAANLKLSGDCEGIFVALLKQYISRFQIQEVCRKQLESILPYNAYDEVAANRRGFIGLGELKSFMRRCDMEMKDSLLELLLHSLKRRCYKFVTLEVFCQNLWPLEFGYYEQYERMVREAGEEQYLKRSRKEEHDVKKLRVDKQKAEGQVRKEERRLEAQLRRNLDQENETRTLIQQDMEANLRLSRKAELETEKEARWAVEQNQFLLAQEARLADISRVRMREAENAKRNQEEVFYRMQREAAMERSRREIQERERQQAFREQSIRSQLERERALRAAQQIQQEERIQKQEFLLQHQKNLLLERQRQAAMRKQLQLDRLKQFNLARQLYPTTAPLSYDGLEPYIQPYRKYREELDKRLREQEIDRVRFTPARQLPKYAHYLVDSSNRAANSEHKKVQPDDLRANLDSRYSRYSSSKKKQPSHVTNPGPGFISFGRKQPELQHNLTTPQQPPGGKYDRSLSKTGDDSPNKKVTFVESNLKHSYIV